jgi:D-alanyl-D-alanine carboxypeptidase/D-alanyl-D-alanine-endopeptidase (penicillin-binding protein 4)
MISIGVYSYWSADQKQRKKNTTEFHRISVKDSSNLRIFLAQCRSLGMKKYAATTTALILLLFWPTMAQDFNGSVQTPAPERIHTQFEETYLKDLSKWGRSLDTHGLYVESLDGSFVLADHQSNTAFNPASVIKIATSFAALDKLGPDYHFETSFEIRGEIKKKTKTLEGDLILASTGDPELTTLDLNRMIRQVGQKGISKVTGSLIVTGPFTYGPNLSTPAAINKLVALMRKQGIRVSTGKRGSGRGGSSVSTAHVSKSLRDIIKYQNDHSDNRIADRLGEAIGGPDAVRQFLIRGVGIPESEIRIERASGLNINRITPHGTVQLLRHLVLWLNFNNMLPQDVLPIAGIDDGTLRTRFTTVDYRGSVIGKTGTLPATDGGVSTLAGFVYTRERGVLLFAIFNTQGNVNTFRKLQDSLIKNLISECGGAELNASLHRSSN